MVEDENDADGTFFLYPVEASQPSGLEHFGAHAQFEALREINWQQTFARRDLRYSDYERVPKGTALRACFKRKRSANAALPEEVSFERKPSADTTLQGEVLTYATEALVIHARLCGSYRFTHTSSDFAAMVIDRVVVSREAVANLASYCEPGDEDAFRARFIDSWVEALSFVRGRRI